MRNSKNGQTDKSKSVTLSECYAAFLEEKMASLAIKTQENYSRAGRLIPQNRKAMRDYTPQDITKLIKDLRPGAYMTARGFLSSLFSFGISRGWATVNPVAYVETKKLGHIARIARDEARKAIQTVPDPMLSLLFETQYACGQRLSDVLAIKPVNINTGQLVITQKKTGNIVDIPISKDLTDKLLALGRQPCEPFFQIKPKKVWAEWRKLRKELGLNMRQSPHSFRKAASCEAAEGGASEAELQALLGHKSPRAASLYRLEANRSVLAGSAMAKREPIVIAKAGGK